MTIPFLGYFKKKSGMGRIAPAIHVPPPPALEKPSSERMSKTVMPNASRTVALEESTATLVTPARATARHSISFGGSSAPARAFDLPHAVALALEPRVERTISLQLQDVVSKMPPGLVRPLENANATRLVLLKASEVERGMSQGKPSISIWTVFQQVPEIFLRKVASDELTEVELPFQKVMEQFGKLQVRADQSPEQVVPQLATPFLKVTLEDDARFGTVTTMAPAPTGEMPPVRVELATAETLAAAEPDAMSEEKFIATKRAPMNFPAAKNPNANGARPAAPAEKPGAPERIPFKLAPKGTDAPAAERVPASSGPSVPTSAPARIPFKMTAPSEEARPKAEPWLTKENFVDADAPAKTAAKPTSGGTVALALKPILQGLLPQQLTGEISSVPDDIRMEIPFSLLEPQLATGRVSLPPAEFAHHLPEDYAHLFDATVIDAPVVLPLPEILKNLPGSSLRMRPDQVAQEVDKDFVTPFSTKAEEDAERLKTVSMPTAKATAPVAAPTKAAAASEKPAVKTPVADKAAPAAKAATHAEEEMDAKAAVAEVAKMSEVKACAIMFSDGLALAGNLPAAYEADGLCAMAPSFLRRIEEHMTETKLGALHSMTLACANATMTFFMHSNLCLAAVHEKEELSADIRERLARVLLELSRKYSHPA